MTDHTEPQDDTLIVHAINCARAGRPPMLRASWRGRPELWCPGCGRTAPADDHRPPREDDPDENQQPARVADTQGQAGSEAEAAAAGRVGGAS